MNKKGFSLSTSFVIKLILALFILLVLISFFTDKFMPFLAKQPIFAKLLILMAIFVLYDNITWILVEVGLE